jgi:hypothetical protein
MAGKADVYEQDLLKLLLNATPIANVADNAATSPLTNLYVSLHSGDPLTGATEAGNQQTSELTYTGYARVAVARNNGAPAWTVTTDGSGVTKAVPNAIVSFGMRTDGGATQTASHFAIGSLSTGTGRIFYAGTITPNISVSQNVTPQLGTNTQITED